jgi:hypothetical protein
MTSPMLRQPSIAKEINPAKLLILADLRKPFQKTTCICTLRATRELIGTRIRGSCGYSAVEVERMIVLETRDGAFRQSRAIAYLLMIARFAITLS